MFCYKKNLIFCLIIVSLSSAFFISCKESSSPTTAQNKILTDANIAKLQGFADQAISFTPGLVAYVAVEGEGELYITRGVSNLTTNEPINPKNFFRIASNTKTFTAEAVLILADEGKIDLNKPINFYLPELNIPSGDVITVRMLGNMTSGLFSYTADSATMMNYYNAKGTLVYTPQQLIAATCRHSLDFTPGSQYEYCNTNFVILGSLIAKVTGESVPQVFQERIFTPLGMTNTSWPYSFYLPYPYTHGYSAVIGPLTDCTNWSPSWGDAAGQLVSNIADLKIWIKEITQGNLLSAASKAERYRWVDENVAGYPGVYEYGYGLMKYKNWIGHSGIISGYNS